MCREVGLPAGVLNILTGLGTEAGAPLVSHPDVDKVCYGLSFYFSFSSLSFQLHILHWNDNCSMLNQQIAFTGSSVTGSKIMTSAAQLVKVCHSISPVCDYLNYASVLISLSC